MTIKEWKERIKALHNEMKEDLGAETLEIHVDEDIVDSYPCLHQISKINISVVAK